MSEFARIRSSGNENFPMKFRVLVKQDPDMLKIDTTLVMQFLIGGRHPVKLGKKEGEQCANRSGAACV